MSRDEKPGRDEKFRKALRERQLSAPLTFSRALTSGRGWEPNVKNIFNLFVTEPGYDTILTKIYVADQNFNGTLQFLRVGLRANGRPLDVWRDGAYGPVDEANQALLFNQQYRGNGFINASLLAQPGTDIEFWYRAKPGQQLSCVVENYLSNAAVAQDFSLFVAGGVLT